MTKSKPHHLNVHDAKTHLSRYLAKVEDGETIVLCRNGVPIAQIIPLPTETTAAKHRFGLGKGMGTVTQDFFAPLTDDDLPDMGL